MGVVIVVVDVKGCAKGWEEANEMWPGGCQSFVAILRGKGSLRRWLMVGIMVRALRTAREPLGGQKSSWTSTIIKAGWKLAFAMLVTVKISTLCRGLDMEFVQKMRGRRG